MRKAAYIEPVNLDAAFKTLERFARPESLTAKIASLERALANLSREEIVDHPHTAGLAEHTLPAALAIKALAGQINVVIHAVGILVALPYILEAGEAVEVLSLGAGNTGRPFDLETDRQVAEFKFITWRGSDTIRQNSTFVDLFNLATATTTKRRVLYVLDKEYPLRFLRGGRSLSSVLSKNVKAKERFFSLHGTKFERVRDYFATIESHVEVVDLRNLVPAFQSAAFAALLEADA
nr:hypothetical protein [Kofleriaceae bacterium]